MSQQHQDTDRYDQKGRSHAQTISPQEQQHTCGPAMVKVMMLFLPILIFLLKPY